MCSTSLDAAIQLFVAGSQFDDFEAVLLCLRNDVSLRNAYSDLKLRWNGKPMDDYRAARQGFIEAALASRCY
jgi:hypothetical protein